MKANELTTDLCKKISKVEVDLKESLFDLASELSQLAYSIEMAREEKGLIHDTDDSSILWLTSELLKNISLYNHLMSSLEDVEKKSA